MRILLGPSSYAPNLGGIEHLTSALATAFSDAGHEVMVVTNRWPAGLPESELIQGVAVERVAMPAPSSRPRVLLGYPAAMGSARKRLGGLVASFRPDVVHAVGASWQAVHLGAVAAGARVPLVLNLQGETAMDDARIYQRSLLLRRAFRHLVERAQAVVACSAWTLEHARTVAPRLPEGRVIPNGVDFAELSLIPPAPGGRRVLAYGRLVRNKGFDLLIEAAVGTGWNLAIGGSGPEEPKLRELAAERGLAVEWLGRLDRAGVTRELTLASVVAVPSRLEPFGIVALEAMAAGRPVAASNIGGIPEFLAGGVAADPANPVVFRAAVEACLASPKIGEQGRQAAAALQWDEVAGQWLTLYSKIVSGG